MIRHADRQRLFDEGMSLVDHLPYGEYIDGVFLHVDGSVGRVLELELPGGEGAPAGALVSAADAIAGLLGRMPRGASFQLLAWADTDVTPVIRAYQDMSLEGQGTAAGRIVGGKIAHILTGQGGGAVPRRIRVFLTVRRFPSWPPVARHRIAAGYFSGSDDTEADLARAWQKIRADLLRDCGMIEGQLAAMGLAPMVIDGEALRRILYRWLNPRRSGLVPLGALRPAFIREQVLYHAPVARGNGFVLDSGPVRVVSLKELPAQTFPGMFAAMGPLFDIHPAMLVAFNFTVPDQAEALARLKFQKAFAFIQRGSSLGDVSEEAVQKKDEISALITQVFKSGTAIVHARMHVAVWGRGDEELDRACDQLMVAFSRAGAEGVTEEIIAPSLFLSCLPLNFDHALEKFVKRERRLLAGNFADMAPLYGAMRGTATPAMLYLNRRAEPVGIDLFDSPTNPHALVIGASGAGKSFFTNDLIYQNYRLGGHFFVLDKGHSYRKTCAILGGQYIHFDLKAPLTINPCVADPRGEDLAFLVEMLALMASGGDERDRLAREEKGFLQKAVLEAYARVKGREVVLSDVVACLEGAMGERLALRLVPFTRHGQYGGFFDGPNAFSINRRFTVFELAQLSAYPDLQLVVLLNIMFFVTRFVACETRTAERKFLLIDEAWQLLKMANTADFMANAFKTFRKYRCSAVAITQEVADLVQQPSGQALLANTANKIFLKQEASVIEQLKKELSLSDEVGALLRGVHTVKGKYSEALVMTPSSTGVVRLVPDPLLYWAATSDPKDNARLKEVQDKLGGDFLAALEHCAGIEQTPTGRA